MAKVQLKVIGLIREVGTKALREIYEQGSAGPETGTPRAGKIAEAASRIGKSTMKGSLFPILSWGAGPPRYPARRFADHALALREDPWECTVKILLSLLGFFFGG